MKQSDLYRTDIDFKALSDQIWSLASKVEHDEGLLEKIYELGKDDQNSVYHYLARLIEAILGGMWVSNEDLAKQMDLNVTDHHKYVEIYGVLNGLE